MLARSLAVLALLAAVRAKDYRYETELQEGQTPQNSALIHLDTYFIPDGQCSGELDMAIMPRGKEPCSNLGLSGIRTLKVVADDNAPYPIIEFFSKSGDGKPDDFVVYRAGDCKGKAKVDVYYECDIVRPPTPKKLSVGDKDEMPLLRVAEKHTKLCH